MIFTPVIIGAIAKLGVNVVNTLMHNSAETKRTMLLQDAEIAKAHIELAKAVQKDVLSKVTRSTIFLLIVLTWCYMGVHGLHNPEMTYDIVLPKGNNWTIGSVFSNSQWEIRKITGSVLMWQWFTITQSVIGFFVVPSRHR